MSLCSAMVSHYTVADIQQTGSTGFGRRNQELFRRGEQTGLGGKVRLQKRVRKGGNTRVLAAPGQHLNPAAVLVELDGRYDVT